VAQAEGVIECDKFGEMIAPPTERQRNAAAVEAALDEIKAEQVLARKPSVFFDGLNHRRNKFMSAWYSQAAQ
jgi:hypothetical protein